MEQTKELIERFEKTLSEGGSDRLELIAEVILPAVRERNRTGRRVGAAVLADRMLERMIGPDASGSVERMKLLDELHKKADREGPYQLIRFGSVLSDLGVIYRQAGRFEEAELIKTRSLKILEGTLGEKHPHVAAVLNRLGTLLAQMGRLEEAEPLQRRAIKIYHAALGEESPRYAAALNALAYLQMKMGRHDEARPLFEQAIRIAENRLGLEHRDTKTYRKNLVELEEAAEIS